MKNFRVIICCIFAIIFLCEQVQVQAQAELTLKEIISTIDSINLKLQQNYIFKETADKMTQYLKTNAKKGNYNLLINKPSEFASQLTKDLQSISLDKHLRVIYDPKIIARERSLTPEDRAKEEAEWIPELIRNLKRDNFGFKEVKILEDNIGYLDLREFADPQYAGETLVSAMNFISNTTAVIIDLRQNTGGSPAMVQLLASYFFSSEPVHLSDHYNRPKNEHTQVWTLPYVPGIRRPDVPLYILTSSKTFSAAEGFSYQLKSLKRATIIGEKTAGGAHLTGSVIATSDFFLRIPQGRVTSPVTNADWEGVGITPHIEVSAEHALETARTKALENLKRGK